MQQILNISQNELFYPFAAQFGVYMFVLIRVLLFLGPQPPAPASGPIYFFKAPCPNYFFTAPNYGITFFTPPSVSKITFSLPLVITTVYHVFFYSFKQNSAYSLFGNYFQQNVLSYINQSIAV